LTAYLISGQAADRRLFENLILPASITVKHIHWIEPLKHSKWIHFNWCFFGRGRSSWIK